MRIGIFTDAYQPQISGVVTSVVTLRAELKKLGHEVFIVTVSCPDKIEDEAGIIRIPSIPFRKWKELRIANPIPIGIRAKIEELNLDVIHTQTEFSIGLMGRRIAKTLKIPIVHTYHTMYVDYTHYIYNFDFGKGPVKDLVKNLSKAFINKCNACISPTKKTKDALVSYGIDVPIYILPTGIDIKHFKRSDKNSEELNSLRMKHGILEHAKVLMFLGRLSEEKSVDFILRAMADIVKKEPSARLLIVGDGPYKTELETMARDLELQDSVVFTGMVPFQDVPKYYSLADVFVNASKTETQGLTIMEAMAAELPIVVFNDTNISEHIKNGVSGRLFDTKDEFVEMSVSALNDKDKNAKLVANGLDVVGSLSKENFAKGAVEIYNAILKNSHSLEDAGHNE